VQLAHDKLTGKAVALKIIFLNRPGLTAEQVAGVSNWEWQAAGSSSIMHGSILCLCPFC
jgi:hypothetical protein